MSSVFRQRNPSRNDQYSSVNYLFRMVTFVFSMICLLCLILIIFTLFLIQQQCTNLSLFYVKWCI